MEENRGVRGLLGLLGHPLGHSFSVAYFREKFSDFPQRGLVYRNFDFEDLADGIRQLRGCGLLRGFNVTIPYKKRVMAYLDGISDEAAAIGAVNTVAVEASTGRWIGHNTDTLGFWESLQDFLQGQPVRRDAKALVLGNGGASQAVQYALARHGISYDLACRPEHAPCAGCGSLRPFAPQRVLPYASLSEDMFRDEIFLIVNATSLGMHPCVDEAPRIPYEGLGVSHYAFDLVYNPAETLFLRRCLEQGANVRNGLDMLYRQADAAWRIWASSSL